MTFEHLLAGVNLSGITRIEIEVQYQFGCWHLFSPSTMKGMPFGRAKTGPNPPERGTAWSMVMDASLI
jgi:hypothetical protein